MASSTLDARLKTTMAHVFSFPMYTAEVQGIFSREQPAQHNAVCGEGTVFSLPFTAFHRPFAARSSLTGLNLPDRIEHLSELRRRRVLRRHSREHSSTGQNTHGTHRVRPACGAAAQLQSKCRLDRTPTASMRISIPSVNNQQQARSACACFSRRTCWPA